MKLRFLELTDFGYGYLVDGGVVNDFVCEPDALLGELLARLVRDLHGTLDAPAESVGLRELHGDGAPGVLVAVLLERLDHIACIPIRFRPPSTSLEEGEKHQVPPPCLLLMQLTGVLLAMDENGTDIYSTVRSTEQI